MSNTERAVDRLDRGYNSISQILILGHILFNIFISDLRAKTTHMLMKFMGDGKLGGIADIGKLEELDNLLDRNNRNDITCNSTKCKVIHFGNNTKNFAIRLETMEKERQLNVLVSHSKIMSHRCDVKNIKNVFADGISATPRHIRRHR